MKNTDRRPHENASRPPVGRVNSRRESVRSPAALQEHSGRMLQVLACGAVVFPGLFFAFRRILPSVFKHWSDADVVLVSER